VIAAIVLTGAWLACPEFHVAALDAGVGAVTTAFQAEQSQAAATAPYARDDGFRRYWLMIGIPGVGLGAAIILTVALLANRARRGKLERGELPEMPD
jgi:hypothetical protein